ncbi:MAG: BrnA antitoxin family protein [Chloroflexi bacterium]|nr:BrnA antitoxin family protein [Chloroflexota bacterium]
MNDTSLTDWERVDALTDEDIDTTDIPPLKEDFFANATLRMPTPKQTITIRLDADVLEWFKQQGKGYQTRINAVLRMYKDAQTT